MSSFRRDKRGGHRKFHQGRGEQSGHPSHLTGRDIGLFYARKNKARQEQDSKRPVSNLMFLGPNISS